MKNLSKTKSILIIIGVYLVIFLPITFLRFPDVRNELKYFVIVEDMIKNDNYLIMKYMGELYPDKPPIYFLLLIFLKKNFNSLFYPLALTFGSLLPALFINLICFNLFNKFRNVNESFIVSLSLAVFPFFLGTSLLLRMDMLMTLFIVGTISIFFKLYFKIEKIQPLKIYMMYIFMGIAILVKGGGGFATPVSIIFLFLLLEKNLKYFKTIKFGRGILIVLAIVVTWLGTLYFQPQGKEYISLLLGQETLGRALKSKAHVRPFYYYLKMLPLTTLPFTLFFLGALFESLKDIKNFKNWDNLEKISFCWSLAPLLFFSMMSGKLDIYLLPAYPGMVALTYCFIFKKENKKLVRLFFYVTLGALLAGIFSLNFLLKKLDWIFTLNDSLILTVITGAILLFGFYSNFKNNINNTIYSLVITLLCIFGSSFLYLERYNDKTSLDPVITYINTTPHPISKVIVYRFPDGVNMSTHISKDILTIESLKELPEEHVLIISRSKYKKDLKDYKELFFNNSYSIFLK